LFVQIPLLCGFRMITKADKMKFELMLIIVGFESFYTHVWARPVLTAKHQPADVLMPRVEYKSLNCISRCYPRSELRKFVWLSIAKHQPADVLMPRVEYKSLNYISTCYPRSELRKVL